MYAIEIETDITSPYLEIPEYENFKEKHVKIIIMVDSIVEKKAQKYDFSDLMGKLEWKGDDVKLQRDSRNEWK